MQSEKLVLNFYSSCIIGVVGIQNVFLIVIVVLVKTKHVVARVSTKNNVKLKKSLLKQKIHCNDTNISNF